MWKMLKSSSTCLQTAWEPCHLVNQTIRGDPLTRAALVPITLVESAADEKDNASEGPNRVDNQLHSKTDVHRCSKPFNLALYVLTLLWVKYHIDAKMKVFTGALQCARLYILSHQLPC